MISEATLPVFSLLETASFLSSWAFLSIASEYSNSPFDFSASSCALFSISCILSVMPETVSVTDSMEADNSSMADDISFELSLERRTLSSTSRITLFISVALSVMLAMISCNVLIKAFTFLPILPISSPPVTASLIERSPLFALISSTIFCIFLLIYCIGATMLLKQVISANTITSIDTTINTIADVIAKLYSFCCWLKAASIAAFLILIRQSIFFVK